MRDIMDYTKNENFKYLVIEASHGDYYGFNLKVEKERTYVMKIVNPVEQNNFMVVGWKVSKTLPKWIHNANSWFVFIDEMGADEVEMVEPSEVSKVGGEYKEEEQENEEDDIEGRQDEDEDIEEKEEE